MSDDDKGFLMLLIVLGVLGMFGGAGYALIEGMPPGQVIGYALAGFAVGVAVLPVLLILLAITS
jgi:hypothetical protein